MQVTAQQRYNDFTGSSQKEKIDFLISFFNLRTILGHWVKVSVVYFTSFLDINNFLRKRFWYWKPHR